MRVAVLAMTVTASGLAGCSDWVATEATVTRIERTCMINERKTVGARLDSSGKERPIAEQRTYEGRCDEVDNWAEEKSKRSLTIDGKAEIFLSYTGPDGSSRDGSIKVTGQDAGFYDVNTGEQVGIRVDADDPERITLG